MRPNNSCACNDCPHMKLNTLEKIYLCLKYELPELMMDEELRLKAKIPMDRMLEISAKANSERPKDFWHYRAPSPRINAIHLWRGLKTTK